MLEKWLPQLANDPAYNRNLSLKHRHFQIETETDVTWNPDFHDRPRGPAVSHDVELQRGDCKRSPEPERN